MPEPGEFLSDRYRIVEVHLGGMGEVFICEVVGYSEFKGGSVVSEPPFRLALKTFQRKYFFNNAVRQAFVREATTWLRLSGLPHILPVIGIEYIGDRPFLQMPAITPGQQGELSIADLLVRGPLEPPTALGYAFQIALALQKATARIQGLVHGDLKPANVLLINSEAFIADFGLVSAASLGRADNRLESSWAYRAPELWVQETENPNVTSDIYAFGALLYEMLVGRAPFIENPHDRNAWMEAHRHKSPTIPLGYPNDGLPTAVMGLAIACLEKEPPARPSTFSEIVQRINNISQEHDPVGQLMRMMSAYNFMSAMNTEAKLWRKEHIRSLLAINEPQQALEELEALHTDDYDAMLWLHRGTALSLLDRDKEALLCFEKAQAGDLSEKESVSCQVEYALSLKRLQRYDEAEEIYEQLIPVVSEQQLPLVVINLATVYLEQKLGDRAVDLLEPYIRKVPDSAPAWANLGQAYVFVRRYHDAEKAFGRALVLAPQEGKIRVMLAALYMDYLGYFEEAWAALDTAFDSGYESRDWLVRMLVCSVILDKQDTIQGLLYALKNHFEESLGQAMLDEAQLMLNALSKRFSSDLEKQTAEEPESSDVTENFSYTSDPESAVEPESQIVSEDEVAFEERREPSLPFLNIRYYESLDFTLDFYQSPNVPNFVETFLTEWRRTTRDPRFAMNGATLRGSPFYFTQCPKCGVYVLTNRTVGKQIRCRMCETQWQTYLMEGSNLDEIVVMISGAMNIEQASGEIIVHLLMVQSPDNVNETVIRQICQKSGMTQLPGDNLLAVYFLQQCVERGVQLQKPWSVWTLEEVKDETWARNTTPPQIREIVQELQYQIPGILTMSTTIPADEALKLSGSIDDLIRQEVQEAEAAIMERRANASHYLQIAESLIGQGQLKEAEQRARAAIAVDNESAQAWDLLGRILFKEDNFDSAREALEQSLALDPNSVLVLHFLAVCYEKLDNPVRARELRARAISLTGGEFPLSP